MLEDFFKFITHVMHPINIWCRIGGGKIGRCLCICYEKTIWRFCFRPILAMLIKIGRKIQR